MTRRTLSYVLHDVFTAQPLQGNQLCVFTQASGLDDSTMQALAKETNLSETTFVIRRPREVEDREGFQVRIFTVAEELPFAGHPTLGTAMVLRQMLASEEQRSVDHLTLDLKVGKVPVRFSADAEGRPFGEMTQMPPVFTRSYAHAELAKLCGVTEAELDTTVPCQTVSTGNAFLMVPFRRLSTLQKLRLDWKFVQEFLATTDAKFLYFVSRETVHAHCSMHARMIFYGGEDPGTGSAAGPCAAWAVRYGWLASKQRAVIEQGVEIGRTCFMHVSAEKLAGDQIINVLVGGNSVEVARGTFEI
jgi:trans-2,3-dihydro-3-hydroxyanthranilate isomerase